MKIVGIVTEYNPFHKGHKYQIDKIRELYGEDTAVVCVMSGDFVQRGEAAVFSKYARAEAAVSCGADLVLELPVHVSIGSAERFAQGAVQILGEIGVDILAFGSETGGIELLERTADVLLTDPFHEAVRMHLESGCSYPTARSKALGDLMNGTDATVSPNDNLGVEYIKAIKQYGYPITPIAIKRMGAMHDSNYDGEMKSGSEIREMIHNHIPYYGCVPEKAYEIYKRETEEGRGPVSMSCLETAILSRLRMLSLHSFSSLADAAEGLDRKMYTACRTESTVQEIYSAVKSKRYTHARIRRMVIGAALGVEKEDYSVSCQFARVLALNVRGAAVIRRVNEKGTFHVLSKPAAIRELSAQQQALFEKTANAHDLYVLAYADPNLRKGEADWKESPRFLAK